MRTVQFQGRHFAPSSVLRHKQVEELMSEKAMCEDNLNRAKFDKTVNQKHFNMRLTSITSMLESQMAKPFESGANLDDAIREEKEIRQALIDSCQSNRVLRHSPAGAVAQLIRWEKENKTKLLYWKGLRLRLHASGVDFGTTPDDVANFEPYRPLETLHDQNMDNTIVPIKTFHPVPEVPDTVMIDTSGVGTVEVENKTAVDPDVEWKIEEPNVPIEMGPTGHGKVALGITLAKPFFSLKKQVKDLTGTAPKNTIEAKSLLKEAGITYKE